MTFDSSLLGAIGFVALGCLGCTVNTSGTGSPVADATDDEADLDDTSPDDIDDDASEPDLPVDCGNGQINPGEDCDGAALAGASCMSLGWDHGALDCANDCQFALDDCGNDPQPGPGELYSTCLDNTDCVGLDGCLTLVDESDLPIDGFCTNLCTFDDECAAPTGGNANPLCRVGTQSTHCALDCAMGLTCPDGMTCTAVEPAGELCF